MLVGFCRKTSHSITLTYDIIKKTVKYVRSESFKYDTRLCYLWMFYDAIWKKFFIEEIFILFIKATVVKWKNKYFHYAGEKCNVSFTKFKRSLNFIIKKKQKMCKRLENMKNKLLIMCVIISN